MYKKEVQFEWTQRPQSAYEEINKQLAGRRVLTSDNESSDLFLATDTSEYGLGGVLFHKDSANLGKYGTRFDEPEERVISYASRTLFAAEHNYSQVEKEALGIIFGVTKFEKYLMGRRFTIYSDHKPLVKLYDSQQGTSATGAARIQRWSLYPSNFNYQVEYRKRCDYSNADELSRLPLSSTESTLEELSNVQPGQVSLIVSTPIDSKQCKMDTISDSIFFKG